MNKILIIGSINVDFVFDTDRIPKQGETIIGKNFKIFDGGKGANQAIAASRFGAEVDFVGAVGEDEFSTRAINNLQSNGVNIDRVMAIENINTGVANIMLNDSDNRIIIVEGANLKIDDSNFNFDSLITTDYKLVLIQSEIPIESIKKIIEICKQKQIKIIYNPAPFKNIEHHFLEVDYITPNMTEYEELIQVQSLDALLAGGVTIIKTCGEDGVQLLSDDLNLIVAAPKVEVVDTTGAGDTFNGVLAACIADSRSIEEAIRLAVKCASHATTKLGAQSAMPQKGELC